MLRTVKKYIVGVVALLMSVGMLCSCGEDRTYQYDELTAPNRAVYNLTKSVYLWADQMTEPDWNGFFGGSDDFFEDITFSSDKWSFVEVDTLTEDYHQRGYFNHTDSYGMDFSLVTDPTGNTNRPYVRVSFVEPGSQAYIAGIRRNDYIASIDGTRVSSSNISSLVSGDSVSLSVCHLLEDTAASILYWTDTVKVEIGESGYVEDYPFLVDTVLEVQGKKFAYLMDTRMVEGPVEKDSASTRYVDDLMNIFSRFKAKSVDELIIDFRFCNYGSIDMANRLASLIVDNARMNTPFISTIWNDSLKANNKTYNFESSLAGGCNLGLSRIAVITSSTTQGAPEWFIHALQTVLGEYNVVTVGSSTAGQNVMTLPYSTPYYVTINPAVAYVADWEGGYGYASGISPLVSVSESSSYSNLCPFGDVNETMLAAAISALINEDFYGDE